MKRQFSEDEPELMDLPGQNEKELREDLKNLERLNRHFGATDAIKRVFTVFTQAKPAPRTLLDLCCGFGDHNRTMAQLARKQGHPVTILALDFQMETLRIAKEATPAEDRVVYIRADAKKLPFAKKSVDAVTCSLALHHFSDSDATKVLEEMARVGRGGLACVDLVRSQFAAWCIWLITTLVMRNRMTVHDARLSIRRAFSLEEMAGLAQKAGWGRVEHWKLGWFRHGILRLPASVTLDPVADSVTLNSISREREA